MSYQRDEIMEKFLHHDKAKIRKVRMFRSCLGADGFEEYVAYYHRMVDGIPTVVRWGFDDEWIDVEWECLVSGKKTKLLVQCKRWSWASTDSGDWYVKKPNVAEFYGNVADIRHSSSCEVRLIYVTTAYFTTQAQKFCKAKGIEMKNYMDLLNMDKEYPLERFIEQRIREWTNLDKTFDLPQLMRYLPGYAGIETKIKEVRQETRGQSETLLEEIKTTENIEIPMSGIIKTDAVIATRQVPRNKTEVESPQEDEEFDFDRWLRALGMGVATLSVMAIALIVIAITFQWWTRGKPLPQPLPTYHPPYVRVQERKNQPVVRKKNVRSTATGTSR